LLEPAFAQGTQLSSIRWESPGRPNGSALPDTPGTLVGRDQDVERVVAHLREAETRLLTLTGVGGIGKTRLALEVAARASDHYANGVAFVALAPIPDASLVAAAITQALGVRETSSSPPVDLLIDAVRERHLLLVVDNFEHVLDAAPVIADLLSGCPRLTVLATSRAPLRLALEREIRVPPLALPNPGDLPLLADGDCAASVRFFVEQARIVVPEFVLTPSNVEAVTAICRRLDGLPLAIMLAAGRSRVLEPVALLARLERRLPLLTGGPRDAPARQRTMRDAITWSYDLLGDRERVLFRRLSVFAGGFTVETAEAMSQHPALVHLTDDDPSGMPQETSMHMLDALELLIDHHLVERNVDSSGDIRLSMLETIREYALGLLEASGETDAVRSAHAMVITVWAERAKPLMFEADQARWLARGAEEQPNVRAALGWTLERGDAATGHRLAAANGPVWLKRAMLREAHEWLERILDLPGSAPVEAVTVCRYIASSVAQALGFIDIAMRHANAGLELAREAGDGFGEGLALMTQSHLLLDRDLDGAEQANEAALARLWTVPGRPRVASCLLQRGAIAQLRGDYPAFANSAKHAYDYAVRVDDAWSVAVALVTRARAAYLNNAFDQAMAHLGEGMTIAQQIHAAEVLGLAVRVGAMVAHACGDHRLAVRWSAVAGAAEALLGVLPDRTFNEPVRRIVLDAKKVIGPTAVNVEEAAALALPFTVAVAEVRAYRPGKRTPQAAGPGGLARLTRREEDVLRLIALGMTDFQIAGALFIARPTVSKHVGSILSKLEAKSRAAAVDTAYRLGLIDATTSFSHPLTPPHT
jgi:predicted ATPase/DNA-binding CsgD family transcriptional regulator